MRKPRTKYLDFIIPDSVWKKQQPFIAVQLDGSKNAKALQRWNPGRYKAEWRVRLKNSHTKEQKSHPLVETIYRDNWIIAIFNTHEAIDAIMGLLPTVIVSTMVAGMMRYVYKESNDETQSSNNSQGTTGKDARL